MYQGGMVAKQEAEKRADAQLLGEKEVNLPPVEEASKVVLQSIQNHNFEICALVYSGIGQRTYISSVDCRQGTLRLVWADLTSI